MSLLIVEMLYQSYGGIKAEYYYGVIIIDVIIYLLFCLSDGYFHEISHAKKAEKLKPSLKTVIIIFIPFIRPRKKMVGKRTIYYLPMSYRTQYLKWCRFNVEDDFKTFSDSEIVVTAEAGIKNTKYRLNVMTLLTIMLGFYISAVSFIVLILNMFKAGRKAKEKNAWNDFRAIYYPCEYRKEYCGREAFEHEVDYNSMVIYGENCVKRKHG